MIGIDPSRLLSGRRGMSRPEKEQVLDRVLSRVEPRLPRRLALAGAAAVAAALAVVLVIRPGGSRDQLTARGGELPAGFEISCVPAPCAAGGKLAFDITSTGGATYFAAFARRGDAWIWYFPQSHAIPPDGGVLGEGIVLGPEHVPGTYTIEGVFSDAPLGRAEIRDRAAHGNGVVTREVVIR